MMVMAERKPQRATFLTENNENILSRSTLINSVTAERLLDNEIEYEAYNPKFESIKARFSAKEKQEISRNMGSQLGITLIGTRDKAFFKDYYYYGRIFKESC